VYATPEVESQVTLQSRSDFLSLKKANTFVRFLNGVWSNVSRLLFDSAKRSYYQVACKATESVSSKVYVTREIESQVALQGEVSSILEEGEYFRGL